MLQAVIAEQEQLQGRVTVARQVLDAASARLTAVLAAANRSATAVTELENRVGSADNVATADSAGMEALRAQVLDRVHGLLLEGQGVSALNATIQQIRGNFIIAQRSDSVKRQVDDDERTLGQLEPRLRKLRGSLRILETANQEHGDLNKVLSEAVATQTTDVLEDTGRSLYLNLPS